MDYCRSIWHLFRCHRKCTGCTASDGRQESDGRETQKETRSLQTAQGAKKTSAARCTHRRYWSSGYVRSSIKIVSCMAAALQKAVSVHINTQFALSVHMSHDLYVLPWFVLERLRHEYVNEYYCIFSCWSCRIHAGWGCGMCCPDLSLSRMSNHWHRMSSHDHEQAMRYQFEML